MTTSSEPGRNAGRQIGQYELIKMLGRGGMAEVYRAYQPGVDRYVAIKLILAHLAADETFIERFRREVRIITRLEHPNIVPVYDFGTESGGISYLVMRLVEGGSLEQKLSTGRLTIRETTRMLNQITSALDYAHRSGVVHRDLKPNNVLLDEQGNAYLTDFGIAKLTEGGTSHALTHTGMIIGTPEYMSPEQWRGEAMDGRADIYSLGVMLFRMLTGEVPFRAGAVYVLMHMHINDTPPSAVALRSEVPPAIDAVLFRALAKQPDDRYATAGDLFEAFEDALRSPRAAIVQVNTAERDTSNPIPISTVQTTETGVPSQISDQREILLGTLIAMIAIIVIVAMVLLSDSAKTGLSGATVIPSANSVIVLVASDTPITIVPTSIPILVVRSTTATPAKPPATNTASAVPLTATTLPATRTPSPNIATTALSPTSTVMPSLPTVTPIPATHTRTPRPTITALPPTVTITATPSPIPPTLTMTATQTPMPTITHTATAIPPTVAPAPTATLTPPPTFTITMTATALPPTVTVTATATFSPTAPFTVTPALSTPTFTGVALPTQLAADTPLPPTATINQNAIAAQQLSYGDTVSGQIDDKHVGSLPWKFVGHYGDQLLITVRRTNANDNLIPIIHILDEAGQPIDWSDNSIADKGLLKAIPLPKDGTYQIIVSRLNTANGTTIGGYTLNLILLRGGTQPTETPTQTAIPSLTVTSSLTPSLTPSLTQVRGLYYGQTVAGILPVDSANDQWTFIGAAGDLLDIRTADALNDGRVFTVTLTGPGIDPPGTVSPQGTLGGIQLAQAGTYTIQVSGKAGQYKLTLGATTTNANPASSVANVIKYGVTITRKVLNENTPDATWQFVGHKGDVITISVTSDGVLDPVVELFDPSGKSIAYNDDIHGKRDAAIEHFMLPSDGTYKAKITRYQGKVIGGTINGGQYSLSLTLEPPIIPSLFSYPASNMLINPRDDLLHYGDTRNGTLTAGASHTYVFLGRVGDTVGAKVQTKSGDLEPTLRLDDDTGTNIYSNNQEEHNQPLDQIQPRKLSHSGKYTLTIGTKTYKPNGGDYRLDLYLNSAYPQLVSDKVQKDIVSAQDTQQAYHLNGVAGEYIRLSARPALNSQLDPFVIFLAPNGRMIAFANSSADRSATISGVQLGESGIYTVIVTHLAETVGEFDLTWSILPNAPNTPWKDPDTLVLSGAHPNAQLTGECPTGGKDTWTFTANQDDIITLNIDRIFGEGKPSLAGILGPDGNPVGAMTASDNGPQAKYHLPTTGTYQVHTTGQHCQYLLSGHWLSNQKPLPAKIDYTYHDSNKIMGTLPASARATLAFTGKTGDKVNLLVYWTNISNRTIIVRWITPDGVSKQLDWEASLTTVKFSPVLTSSGTYKIAIENNSTADVTLTIDMRADVPEPTATPITSDLSNGQVLITQPNATGGAVYQFLAHAGQRVHMALEVPSNQSPTLTLMQPDGKLVESKSQLGNGYNTFDAALSQDGQYTVIVSNAANKPLRFTFALLDGQVLPTPTIVITPEAAGAIQPLVATAGTGSFSTTGNMAAGSSVLYSFDGIAGQTALVSLFISPPIANVPTPGPTQLPTTVVPVYAVVTLFDPDGMYVGESSTADGTNRALPVLRSPLIKTGKYTVEIRARGAVTKTPSPFYLTVVAVAPNATATPVPLNTLPFERIQKATLTAGGAITWQFTPTQSAPLTLFVVRPTQGATLRASVDVYTIDGFWEGSVTANTPGDDARLLIPLSSAQAYRVVVRALDNTSGDYTIYTAGNAGGIVVFSTKRLTVTPYKGPNPSKYPTDRLLFGDNYEAFAQNSNGQWLELRDPVTHRYVWVRIDQVEIMYGKDNIQRLPVDQPLK